MLRSLAEYLSRGRSFRRRLPREYGGCQMYVSPECGLSFWFGMRLAEDLLENAAEIVKQDHVVWDVGANMGIFTFAAAGLAGPTGRVFAFEPDTQLVHLLRRSAMLNRSAAQIEIIPCAVADVIGISRFNIANRARASNFLEGFGSSQTGGVRETQTVMTVSLDWMAERIPVPDVLKIDVEGAEEKVFRGGLNLLRSKRPILLFESSHPKRQDETGRLLRELRYVLYDADVPAAERKPLTKATYDTIAIPG